MIFEFGYVHLVRWAFGSLPVGTFDQWTMPLLLYGPYTLAMLHYLDKVAGGAFATFKPALGVSDAEAEVLRYELVTLPARGVRPAIVVGLLLGAATLLLGRQNLLERLGATPVEILVVGGPLVAFGYGLTAVFVYHTYRQLRLVARIHREAQRLDLYDEAPLFAFSRLTARTGLAYLAVAYFTLTVNSGSLTGDIVSLGTSITAVCVGIACFVLPLLGIHGRLTVEKARLMEAANRRLQVVTGELYQRMTPERWQGSGT